MILRKRLDEYFLVDFKNKLYSYFYYSGEIIYTDIYNQESLEVFGTNYVLNKIHNPIFYSMFVSLMTIMITEATSVPSEIPTKSILNFPYFTILGKIL